MASVDLYGGDTFTVLWRAHTLASRTSFTLSHHGRHNWQTLSNLLPLPEHVMCGVNVSTTWHCL